MRYAGLINFIAGLLLAGLALLAGPSLAAAEPRVALVIGNADYGSDMGRLINPKNDAVLMKQALRKAGFEVIAITDADQKGMKRAISDFGKHLAAAGHEVTALFYYSGHGLQVAGENYLIPVGADIKVEADVDLEAISADTILKQMQFADARVNIIILDACRNNPLPRGFRSAQAGLARMDAPRGSFVAYSTAPGDVARDGTGENSPYTAALATAITTPGLSIEEAFRNVRGSVLSETGNAQVPWESSSLTAPFFFTPAAQASTSAASSTGTAQDPREIEVTFWNSVKDSQDPADFAAYLEQYPQGNFARLAKNRLALLSAPQTEPQLPEITAATPAPATAAVATSVDVPSDPEAAAKVCHDDKSDAEHRLAACRNALQRGDLGDVARADFTNEIGRAHYELRKYPEAEAAYREAMRLDPKEAAYPANLGLALADAGQPGQAVAAYSGAIALDGKNVWHFYNRGYAYLNSGDVAGAAADFDTALSLEENADVLAARGFVNLAAGSEQAAIDDTMRALAADGSAYNLQSVAILYMAERDKEAGAMLDRLIKAEQGYGYGQIWQALLLTRQGKSGAARSLLTQTLADHGNDWPGMLMRWMLGKFDDATLLRKAQEGTRRDVTNQLCEANFYLGERAFTAGRKAEAARYFTEAAATEVYNYVEYQMAKAYLRRLQGGN